MTNPKLDDSIKRVVTIVVDRLIVVIGWYLLLYFLVVFALGVYTNPKDDTDSPTRRSGIALRIDNLTGCQYLEGARGGLTPRTDPSGNHICTGE